MTIVVRDLSFRYRGHDALVLDHVSMTIEPGSRCLLIGANGAGKSTLLRVLGGKHMVPIDSVRVLGRPAFHDTSLAADVAFLGGLFPFDVDMRVAEIIDGVRNVDPERRARLIDILGVDLEWRMHTVSDGQRKRVQLLLGLLRPSRVLLLDEITTDLDVVARDDLLGFLRAETEERGAIIVYATHIFDGLGDWASHIAFIEDGRVARMAAIADIEPLAEMPLWKLVTRWLRGTLTL